MTIPPCKFTRNTLFHYTNQHLAHCYYGSIAHLYIYVIYLFPGYGKGLAEKFLAGNDLQRIDMGIAMCHWALIAQEAGLHGEWAKVDPGIALANAYTEYTIRWIPA